MAIHRLVHIIQPAKRPWSSIAAFTVTLFLIACVNQSPTPVEQVNITPEPSANNVIQVDGSIPPDTVLQAATNVEPNPNATLLTPVGAVSPQGDRIVQVLNRLEQNGLEERSTLTVLDANANPLANRELRWLVWPVKFSPDGSRIITSGSDRTTRVWDAQLNPLDSFDGHQVQVQSLQISPDGNYMLTIEYPDVLPPGQQPDQVITARLLDLEATQLESFEGLQIGSHPYNSHPYQYMQFSPDSRHLLTVSKGVVQVLDLQGNPQLTLNQDQPEFFMAQFSPDGQAILAAGSEIMKLWDSQGQLKAEFSHWTVNPAETISSIQLSNKGQVVTGSSTGILRVWDAQSNPGVTVKAHEGQIHAIAINSDGSRIATLGEKTADAVGDNLIRVWNRQGQLLGVLGEDLSASFFKGVLNALPDSFSLQFTADGTQLIATQTGQVGTTIRWTL
jgi:WD40 repeat protein